MQSTPTKRTRRHHAPDLKREVILACQQPGASVAGVALAHGLNAVSLQWPATAAAECGAWLREWLR